MTINLWLTSELDTGILWANIVKEGFSIGFKKYNTCIVDVSILDLRRDGWILKGYSLKVFNKQVSNN